MALTDRERRLIEGRRNDFLPVLVPGMRTLPLVIPYCRMCGEPCELHQAAKYEPPWHVWYEGECCGKQQGRRVSIEEIQRIQQTGEKLWLVVGKGQSQTIEKRGGSIMVGGRRYKVSAPGTVKVR